MNEPTMNNLVQRLDRLEGENCWLKRIVALVLVGIAAVVLMGQATPKKVAKVIKAEKFLLVDKDTGVPSAALEKIGNSAGLFLYGLTGKKIAEVSASFGVAPKIKLYGTSVLSGNDGKALATLSTWSGIGELKLFDTVTSQKISLGRDLLIYPDKSDLKDMLKMGLGLIIYGKDDYPRVKLNSFSEGHSLRLFDKKANLRFLLTSDSDGPSLSFFDKDGQKRATLGSTSLETTRTGAVTKRAESSLVLFDKKGKVLWSTP